MEIPSLLPLSNSILDYDQHLYVAQYSVFKHLQSKSRNLMCRFIKK